MTAFSAGYRGAMAADEERNAEPAIERELAMELDKHRGQWVAVDRSKDRLVATGESASSVIDAAQAKGVTDPLVFRVSAHPERISFL